ncbi:DUF151 domain-containing protein [Alistipes sp. OttesenSCG-928-L06]|nr:DUF151 domain-containing protein [Alistipes sp. OttesenSCG-928-L06]
MKYIEVTVKEIIQDPESDGCCRLVLEDVEGGQELPIVISSPDARPVAAQLNGERNLRPATHDLFAQFIAASGYRLDRLLIQGFRRGIFYASAVFAGENKEPLELDCRPSDGVALALRAKAPILASEEVMQQVGRLACRDMGQMKLPQRIQAMERKLQRLVQDERYEEAGILRDRIQALKTSGE